MVIFAERATVHFDAHSISKPDSSSSLTELDEEDVERQEMKETLSQDVVNAVVNEFREKLNLTLFGIDIIVEKETGRHAIIDVNVFPGNILLLYSCLTLLLNTFLLTFIVHSFCCIQDTKESLLSFRIWPT